VHRNQHVKEAMKVMYSLRKRETLPKELGVDEVKLGKSIY